MFCFGMAGVLQPMSRKTGCLSGGQLGSLAPKAPKAPWRRSLLGIGLALAFALVLLPGSDALHADVTVQFRQGDADYTGTEDSHLSVPARFYLDQSPDPASFSTADGRNGNFATDPENEYFAWDWENCDVGDAALQRTCSASWATSLGQCCSAGRP